MLEEALSLIPNTEKKKKKKEADIPWLIYKVPNK
jgi:hypothetical protein